uniref:Uncharacterized protein n=1 Tax=Cacopsylla melanoneura TaxID=428564 RepID=A0A8D8RGD9_9HEMI
MPLYHLPMNLLRLVSHLLYPISSMMNQTTIYLLPSPLSFKSFGKHNPTYPVTTSTRLSPQTTPPTARPIGNALTPVVTPLHPIGNALTPLLSHRQLIENELAPPTIQI